MENIVHFIRANSISSPQTAPSHSKKYKCGVVGIELLEAVDLQVLDSATYARYLYLKNLVLNDPVPFEVPTVFSSAERSLMFLSFNDFDNAIAALGLNLQDVVVGAIAAGQTGALSNRMVLKLTNTRSSELYPYGYGNLTFREFQVEPLDHAELIYLYIKIKKLSASDENRDIFKDQVMAYVERALFSENQLTGAFLRALHLCRAEFTNEASELEAVAGSEFDEMPDYWSQPITFAYEINMQLGRSYMANFDYGAGYEILKQYPAYDEIVACLIALKKWDLAAQAVQKHISLIQNIDDRSDQIILANLYIKLGHIHQDPSYFDQSASIFCCAKPFHLKGLWHFNRKNFPEALEAFSEALRITPNCEQVRFSYGCTLVQLERIADALKVFRLLKAENPQSETITKNLSFCYYKLQDIENTLSTLRTVALHDHSAMKQFFYISIKNDKLENVRWALKRMHYDESLGDAASYLVHNNKMDEAELRALLGTNAYISTEHIESFFESWAST